MLIFVFVRAARRIVGALPACRTRDHSALSDRTSLRTRGTKPSEALRGLDAAPSISSLISPFTGAPLDSLLELCASTESSIAFLGMRFFSNLITYDTI